MIKKIWKVVLRLIAGVLVLLSAYLMLTSYVRLQINDTHAMTKHVVRKVVNDSDNMELGLATNFLEQSGLEDELLKSFPKKYSLDLSYIDLYRLSNKYQETGKITTKDLNLNSKNRLGEIVNEYIVKEINNQLKEDSRQVYHIISIYRYSIFLVILVYILALVLILFGKYSAFIPLLLASVGSFGVLWYFSGEATTTLKTQIYHGISVKMSQGIWLGLVIGVAVAIIWPLVLRMINKNIDDSEEIKS